MVFYAFGSNGSHQLGLGGPDDDVKHLTLINNDISNDKSTIEQVASGGKHTMFLTTQGRVWASGSNELNQLGIVHSSSEKDKIVIKPVPILGRWRLVSAGWQFSVMVDINGQIFSAGSGPKGELGQGPKVIHSQSLSLIQKPPELCKTVADIVQLKSGLAHTLILYADGSVWGFGASRRGQLGSANKEKAKCYEPVLVYYDPENHITDIACGREFSVLGNRNTGFVTVLGTDKVGLVTGAPQNLLGFKQLDCGWSNIHILSNDGKILSWGNDSHSQLAVNSPIHRFTCMAIGSEHGLAVDAGSLCIYAWGWGEHGNCGPEGLLSRPGMCELLKVKDVTSVRIWAGHATSWISIDT